MRISEKDLINLFLELQEQAKNNGFQLGFLSCSYCIENVPGSRGKVAYETLPEIAAFIRGYELGTQGRKEPKDDT